MFATRTGERSMTGFERLLSGRTVAARYRIGEVIGRGGMGAVYRATDERLGREVAVKVMVLATGVDELRERMRVRFHREARAAARLHHPNVVTVHDFGTDPDLGLDYLVMELLHGEDVAQYLERRGPAPLAEALDILRQAARGLAAGHRAGLVHRDVKPGNLFLSRDEDGLHVRVLDFGIARVDTTDEDATSTHLTRPGHAPLSRAYAAPEQLRGEDCATPACDVWALGATAYQLLLGRKPFTEADTNRMTAGFPAPVPSMRAYRPQIPAELEQTVHRALAWAPEARFPDAASFLRAIGGGVESGAPPATTPKSEPRPRRRIPWRAAAAVGVIGLLGLGGVEAVRRWGPGENPGPPPEARWEVVGANADYACSELFEFCVRVKCTIRNVGTGPGEAAVQASLRGGPSPIRKTERALVRPKEEKTLVMVFREAKLGEDYEPGCRIR